MENGHQRLQEDGVFNLIQLCHYETEKCIDTVMTFAELSSSTVDFALVRPLTTLLAKTRHPGLLYALLVVRQNWLNAAEENLAFQGVNTTRATLCEMLATKCLSLYPPRSHALARALTSYHNPFSGATMDMFDSSARPTEEELEELLEEGDRFGNSALELSIETSAKRFIRCPTIQQFIQDLYNGEIIYRPSSQHSLISDDYKSDAVVEPYDFARTGLLDHYTLRIPRVRRLLDFATIVVLVFLFVMVQRVRDIERMEAVEVIFIVYAFGFAMEEAASIKERGYATYTSSIWNMLDMGFLCTFFVYFALRVVALAHHSIGLSTLSFDVLAIGACFLFPRVCSILLTDSVVMIGLRAMLADYMAFLFFAVLCSFGFYLAFAMLGRGVIPAGQLAWMMVKVFLGNSYVGFELAPILHPHLGPALMLVYAVFSGTLLVTILISILSNTFSNVTVNVVDEALFQKAVTTLDMVKGDALSEHCVPMNLVALPVLLPASFFSTSRHFHRLNVFVIRATHFPILIAIHLFYRLTRRPEDGKVHLHDKESSDLWQSFSGLRRTIIADRLFERPVTKAGRTIERLEQREQSTQPRKSVSPVAIRGSGGQRALAMQTEDGTSSSYGATAQPSGVLAQLFGGSFTSRSSSQDSQTAPPSDERYAALEAKLDKIEEMVSRLVTGGLSLENNDSQTGAIE